MLSLNLLPENLKSENKLSLACRLAVHFYITIVFFITIIAVFFLLSMIIINLHHKNDIYQAALINESKKAESTDENKSIMQFGVISKIQGDFIPWSFLINELSKNIKNDISLNGLNIDKNKKTAILTGQAGTRESLLDLKEYLENTAYFNNVSFPIKNILEKENIAFEIIAGLNIESIAKAGLTINE